MLRQFARTRVARVFTRFAAGSAVGTVTSQLTFLLVFGVLGASAAVSGVAAFLAGAVPNFLIHRFWTWQRSGRAGMRRDVARYLAVITVNGLLATGLTAGVDRLVGAGIDNHALRTVVLAVIFSASYVLLFVLKFTLLDRLVFPSPNSSSADPATGGPARADAPADAAPGAPDDAAADLAHRTDRSRHQVPTITRA